MGMEGWRDGGRMEDGGREGRREGGRDERMEGGINTGSGFMEGWMDACTHGAFAG